MVKSIYFLTVLGFHDLYDLPEKKNNNKEMSNSLVYNFEKKNFFFANSRHENNALINP